MSETEFQDLAREELAGYSEADLRQLVENVYQLDELTKHPGWPLYVDLITAMTVTRQRRILGGGCHSLEDYAKETGWIQGAQAAMAGPQTMRDRLTNVQTEIDAQAADAAELANERNHDET